MKRLALALSAALLLASAPAFADGHRHKSHGYGGYHGKSHGHGFKRHGYGHRGYRYRGHKSYGYGPAIAGVLAGGIVLGHLLSRPAYRAPRHYAPPRPRLSNCHATTGTHRYHGRPARFGGTMCYDSYGRAYIAPGSRYFIGYLY